MDNSSVEKLIVKSIQLEKYSLSQLISKFEGDQLAHIKIQASIIKKIQKEKISQTNNNSNAIIIGWTGTPGVGKSSLLNAVCTRILEQKKNLKIGILAIDPTSHLSGGSLLGDRTRVHFPAKEKRIFFRSQPTELMLGGLGRYTFSVTLLMQEIFDILFIETVGIGQNEIEIKLISEYVTLIMQPFAGDEIQFMKAGIMEIPDILVINKYDEKNLAKNSYRKLVNTLQFNSFDGKIPPIFKTSVLNQKGINKLSDYILQKIKANIYNQEKVKNRKEQYFLNKLIKQKYGEYGLSFLTNQLLESNYFEATYKILSRIKTLTNK